MIRIWQFVICACLLASQLANAQVFGSGPNLHAAIVDNNYEGDLASMTCVDIVASGAGTVPHVKVAAYLDHTWIGDLTLKLVSPAGVVVTLMSRPGFAEPADDGTGSSGESSNLVSSIPVEFVDGGPKSAELMGDTLINLGVVCRDDAACIYAPNSGAADAGTLATFAGTTLAGTWKFCAGDSDAGDTGAIEQVLLTFDDKIFSDGFGG